VSRRFSLFLFTLDGAAAATAVRAGIDGLIVDWETRGKSIRQLGAGTEINSGTVAHLRRVRAATSAQVLCRINPFGADTEAEVECALAGGADEILVPMVRTPADVVRTLEVVDGRCATGILIETQDAVDCAAELARLPLSRVYVGLNDLAIDRGTPSIFSAVADGTVARLPRLFDVPFGFAGLTVPDRGDPVPCRLLIAEMARLGCAFSFLRRSYRRDVGRGESAQRSAVSAIRAALESASSRSSAEIRRDRHELQAIFRRDGLAAPGGVLSG
jgi:HpcH/HpaI aldolase/citrate lyase family